MNKENIYKQLQFIIDNNLEGANVPKYELTIEDKYNEIKNELLNYFDISDVTETSHIFYNDETPFLFYTNLNYEDKTLNFHFSGRIEYHFDLESFEIRVFDELIDDIYFLISCENYSEIKAYNDNKQNIKS